MAFSYKQVTISGQLASVEGTSRLIQELRTFMVNDLGWTLTEDQTNRAGTSHQITLQSNGEDGTNPTFYINLTSGTGASAAAGQRAVNVRAATAWDTNTHRVAASGVGSPTASGSVTIGTDPEGLLQAWFSGSKDSVVVMTRAGAGPYDGTYFGLVSRFSGSISRDPFPVYVVGTSTSGVTSLGNGDEGFTFLNATTAISSAGQSGLNSYHPLGLNYLGTASNPQNIFGAVGDVFTVMPVFGIVSTASAGSIRSYRGVAYNLWSCVASGTGPQASEDELVTANNKRYKMFFNASPSQAAVIRIQ